MKIVLDTNVLVSGLLRPFGAPGDIVRMTSSGTLELCYDARILSEYQNVLLRPKFHFDQDHVDALFDQIKACGHVVAAKPLAKALPDPNDEPFLEVALAGKARCLVTENLRHYPTKKQQNIPVLSPTQFLEAYRGKL